METIWEQSSQNRAAADKGVRIFISGVIELRKSNLLWKPLSLLLLRVTLPAFIGAWDFISLGFLLFSCCQFFFYCAMINRYHIRFHLAWLSDQSSINRSKTLRSAHAALLIETVKEKLDFFISTFSVLKLWPLCHYQVHNGANLFTSHLYYSYIIGKKVEVSLQLFDIFERNMDFIFLCESWESHRADRGLRWNW